MLQKGRGFGTLKESIPHPCAPIAQLDRASGYEPEGRPFESVWAHHLKSTISIDCS